MDSSDLYLAHRALIDQVVRSVCRRHHLSQEDSEDLSSQFNLRLVEEDFESLRRFEGRSSLRTYLFVVVLHFFQDWRNAKWGKWRPSAEAKRLGPIAVRLETLVVRDGLSVDEAQEILRTRDSQQISRSDLEAMVSRFPRRRGRTQVGEEELRHWPDQSASADGALRRDESTEAIRQAMALVSDAVSELKPEDRLLLRLSFEESVSMVDIARMLHGDQKRLYRRRERLLRHIRQHLEARGCGPAVVDAACEGGELGLRSPFEPSEKFAGGVRPSELRDGAPEATGRAE